MKWLSDLVFFLGRIPSLSGLLWVAWPVARNTRITHVMIAVRPVTVWA